MPERGQPGSSNDSLQRRRARLAARLSQLDRHSERFSWYRLAAVLLGGALTWLAGVLAGWPWSGWAFGLSALLFGVLVLGHNRIDRWRFRFGCWLEFLDEQLAREARDWPAIPQPPLEPEGERSRLQIDLDLTGPRSLHHLLCVAVSRQGAQRLADWLSVSRPTLPQIVQRQQLVRELAGMRGFRRRLVVAFREVEGGLLEGQALVAWLTKPVSADRLGYTLVAAGALAAVNLILFFLNAAGRLPPYWPLTLGLYLLFTYATLPGRKEFLDAVLKLDAELDKLRALLQPLETSSYAGRPQLEALAEPFHAGRPKPSVHLRQVKLTTAGIGLRMNPVLGGLINLFVPWDIAFAFLAVRLRARLAELVPRWLDAWYELEAALSLAQFAEQNPGCAFPAISESHTPVFEARGLGHPLLPPDQRVSNDFTVRELGDLVLITGSNMSGKSTFLKTIGINLCMAYAGGPVQAAGLRALPFRLHSCIQIKDSLVEGFSYFYAEVRCLRQLLDALAADGEPPLLYLIDEIFRGTNNRERMIGGRAVVRHLIGKSGVGFLATHDLELAGLAEESPGIRNVHFRDQVEDGRLAFDYQVHAGASTTTNALKIMTMEGLPLD